MTTSVVETNNDNHSSNNNNNDNNDKNKNNKNNNVHHTSISPRRQRLRQKRQIILAQAPQKITSRFYQIGFIRSGGKHYPVLIVNPLDVPNCIHKHEWFNIYENNNNVNNKKDTSWMKQLIYLYGPGGSAVNKYRLVPNAAICPYNLGVQRGYDKEQNDEFITPALIEMKRDIPKKGKERGQYYSVDLTCEIPQQELNQNHDHNQQQQQQQNNNNDLNNPKNKNSQQKVTTTASTTAMQNKTLQIDRQNAQSQNISSKQSGIFPDKTRKSPCVQSNNQAIIEPNQNQSIPSVDSTQNINQDTGCHKDQGNYSEQELSINKKRGTLDTGCIASKERNKKRCVTERAFSQQVRHQQQQQQQQQKDVLSIARMESHQPQQQNNPAEHSDANNQTNQDHSVLLPDLVANKDQDNQTDNQQNNPNELDIISINKNCDTMHAKKIISPCDTSSKESKKHGYYLVDTVPSQQQSHFSQLEKSINEMRNAIKKKSNNNCRIKEQLPSQQGDDDISSMKDKNHHGVQCNFRSNNNETNHKSSCVMELEASQQQQQQQLIQQEERQILQLIQNEQDKQSNSQEIDQNKKQRTEADQVQSPKGGKTLGNELAVANAQTSDSTMSSQQQIIQETNTNNRLEENDTTLQKICTLSKQPNQHAKVQNPIESKWEKLFQFDNESIETDCNNNQELEGIFSMSNNMEETDEMLARYIQRNHGLLL